VRVLVTGASSLLGGALVTRLLHRGDEVTAFQRHASGTGAVERLGDIRDPEAVGRAARGHDAIVHLAALVAPSAPWADAEAVNVEGTRHVLAAARSCGRLVHVSSPSVAFDERAAVGAAAEPARYRGSDSYARSKAVAEELVLERHELCRVVVRPHLVWGPGDDQLVGRIVSRARRGLLALPDGGRALIDSTYVDDASSALVAALDAAVPGHEAVGRAWVVTGGDPRPVAELVGGILAAAGQATTLRSVPAPLAALAGRLAERLWPGSEPPLTRFAARQLSLAHWFDQRETKRVLAWSPTVSIDEGLERLADWYRSGS
jgi:nucleoside-diphosphate-sugar epimerase